MFETVESTLNGKKSTGKRYSLEGKCIYSFYGLSASC